MGVLLSKLKHKNRRKHKSTNVSCESHDSAIATTGGTSIQRDEHYLNINSNDSGFSGFCELPGSADTAPPVTLASVPETVEPLEHPKFANRVVIGLFRYTSREDGDVSFEKGETMFLIDNSNKDWWYVKLQKNGEQGFAPRNFLAQVDNLESQEWYGGKVSRIRAERLVLQTRMPRGTFLIRERQSCPGQLALTIRDVMDEQSYAKHYKIHRLDTGGYYITSKRTFATMQALVHHYSTNIDGLCAVITFPAPRAIPTVPDISPNTNKKWDIPKTEFEIQKTLGKGHFGEVYYGKWRKFVDVAIKTIRHRRMEPEEFLREAKIMKECDHPHLVKLYAVCIDEEPFWIVTEFMENGNLRHYLGPTGLGNDLNWTCLIDIAAQVASAMAYLEAKRPNPIVHRDLAARNVLVGKKVSGVPTIKVADFGLARKTEDEIYTSRDQGPMPYRWSAPEAILQRKFSVKSDVWSFGILLHEIMTRGSSPYEELGIDIDTHAIVKKVVHQNYRMPCPVSCPPDVYGVMQKCWNSDANARPSFEELYHFFDEYFVSVQPTDFSDNSATLVTTPENPE